MKSSILKSVFLLLFVILFICTITAQSKFYEKKEFINTKNDTLRYLLLRNQRGNDKVPLIIYLHGGGERGRDNEKQLIHSPKIITDSVFRLKYSFCFIAPQCAPQKSWVNARKRINRYKMKDHASSQLRLVKELLDSFIVTNDIDEKRIYITGGSMGGCGTWDLVCRYPNKFAAAMIQCGIGDTHQAKKIIHVPIWVFHGDKDVRFNVRYSRKMIQAIRKAGGNPIYTEYPGLPHDISEVTYNNIDIWKWLFLQKIE